MKTLCSANDLLSLYSLQGKVTRRIRLAACFLIAVMLASICPAYGGDYRVGVYYFPGWSSHKSGATYAEPWEKIKPFPERKPTIGWYDDGALQVLETQIAQMHQYGINFIAFDWYYGAKREVQLGDSLRAYLQAKNRKDVQFALLWANHTNMPQTLEDWDSMIRLWVNDYFSQPEYLRIGGRPVVFVLSTGLFSAQASKCGVGMGDLLSRANAIAHQNGVSDIYFVAGSDVDLGKNRLKSLGFSSASSYVFHGAPRTLIMSHSFPELDLGYRAHWDDFLKREQLPYIVPVTAGWDKRPWGGSKDALHDLSRSTPEEFGEHLLAARNFIDSHPAQTARAIVICCWNEFGEGSYIEPTEGYGTQYLEQIRSVFVLHRISRP